MLMMNGGQVTLFYEEWWKGKVRWGKWGEGNRESGIDVSWPIMEVEVDEALYTKWSGRSITMNYGYFFIDNEKNKLIGIFKRYLNPYFLSLFLLSSQSSSISPSLSVSSNSMLGWYLQKALRHSMLLVLCNDIPNCVYLCDYHEPFVIWLD